MSRLKKDLKKLNQKKYRDKTNLFLIEGEHLVKEAYQTGNLKELLVLDGSSYNFDVPTNFVTSNVMSFISSLETPTDIIGICSKPCGAINGNHILILDEIQDPGNLGTIIRSSVAFNVDTIVISEKCADVYSPKVVRASQGMLFHINIVQGSLYEIIPNLKEKGYQILGTKVTDGNDIKTIAKNKKFAIIMGNEGSGVKSDILDLCDKYVYITMNDNCESLNVAVATSIILYELDK